MKASFIRFSSTERRSESNYGWSTPSELMSIQYADLRLTDVVAHIQIKKAMLELWHALTFSLRK